MPAARLPDAKAKALGADRKDPQRFRDRKSPASGALGKPSTHLTKGGMAAWEAFKRELPWLTEADRAVMEICCSVRGRLFDGEDVGVTALSMYQSVLSKLGATPADRSKVSMPDDEAPADEFFGVN
jgi:hypothetical protein